MYSPSAIERVAVVGGGTIGASWAALFLSRGLQVTLTDPAPGAEAIVRERIAHAWENLPEILPHALTPQDLRFEADLERGLAGAQFVQENAPEREAFKIELFQRMDALLPPEVIIASSSSGLLMTRVQSACAHPERCLIGHPFNPPHLIPLVEVVGGERTSPAAMDAAMAFYKAIGKYAIRLHKEVPGHIANRLQAALWREATHLAAEGVASVADIDAAISQGPGLRWALFGPHMTFNLGGGEGGMNHFLDHLWEPMQKWWDDLGNPQLTDELRTLLVQGVNAEAQGRSIAELARERDQRLLALLAMKARPTAAPKPQIQHLAEIGRFELIIEGHVCELDYQREDKIMTITHTGVPPALGGRGIAAELTEFALKTARDNGWKIRPQCSYAAAYFKRHPEHADLLA